MDEDYGTYVVRKGTDLDDLQEKLNLYHEFGYDIIYMDMAAIETIRDSVWHVVVKKQEKKMPATDDMMRGLRDEMKEMQNTIIELSEASKSSSDAEE